MASANFIAFVLPSLFKIHVVVPARPINAPACRGRKIRFDKYQLSMANGRDISIYATANEIDKRFLVFDVPTTLMTTLTAIDKVSKFWEGADKPFEERLAEREAVTFRRAISGVAKDRQVATGVEVISVEEFEKMAFE